MRYPRSLFILAWALISAPAFAESAPPTELRPGMVINRSVLIKKGIYRFNGQTSLEKPVILIQGNNITIDFNKCVLQGSTDKQWPNEFYGLAILVRGDNITLKNVVVKGYKVAIMADSCKGLVIEHCDASYNYRQHLQSNWMREDLSDWMSFHHNEKGEWLRYGAGIYLQDCSKATIRDNTVTGGQCGLMMTRCNDGMIYQNDFSFNSALGIGMYRSSRNLVVNNRLDFNVRGYSHGFYNRGQDSAGLLVFEQCNDNTFAYNSVTHGGDGFFLWAGQTTMDTGEGGCNDNLLFANDFSYAPTNGVEVTFSRNRISNNRILECDHGIWGGYSYQTQIIGNQFDRNRIAIAIEHGQDNNISFNEFNKNKEGIRLWARKQEPGDWVYPKKRDTRSMKYFIDHNSFYDEAICVNLKLTENVQGKKNGTTRIGKFLKMDSTVFNVSLDSGYENAFVFPENDKREKQLLKWNSKKLPRYSDTIPAGRKYIHITEWGPYDFRYPAVFLNSIDSQNICHFELMGPKGNWKLISSHDLAEITMNKGGFPSTLTARISGTDRQLELEYDGPGFTDQFGNLHPAGKPYRFSFRDFQPVINWSVNWFAWDPAHDPNKDYTVFLQTLDKPALKSEKTTKLDYTWWGPIGDKLPADSFATVAEGEVTVKKGRYALSVTADDLVKVFVDRKPVIDFWDAAQYKYDEDAHHRVILDLEGTHRIRIIQVENSGYATLLFYLNPL